MVRQVIWSRSSLLLLHDIFEYWNERNGTTSYSEKLYYLFQISLNQLAKYPESGGLTYNERVRYKKVKSYYLYFTYSEIDLKVIAICHVSRSPEFVRSLLND